MKRPRNLLLWSLMLLLVPSIAAGQVDDIDDTIEETFREFGGGIRGGVTLDPELVNVGIHGTFGPFFDSSIAARPNVEVGFGEITTLVAVNLEGVYFFPYEDTNDHRFYAGGGIGLNFIDRGIDDDVIDDDVDDLDDDDFLDNYDYETGLNLLGGVEWREGTFIELRATAYGGAGLRVILGYTF